MKRRIQQIRVTRGDLSDLADQIVDLVLNKNQKYQDAWQRFGLFEPLLRIGAKLVRVEFLNGGVRLALGGDTAEIRRELEDVIGYALLAILYIDKTEVVDEG